MIKVRVIKDKDLIKSIEARGHANFDVIGKDIVCAGVSAILVGGLNAMEQLSCSSLDYKMNEGHLLVNVAADERMQQIAQVMIIQLLTIEDSYPKNVHIEYNQ